MGAAAGVFAGASLLGSGIQAYGAYEAGKQQKALNEYNASAMDAQAQDAQVRGEQAIQAHWMKVNGLLGDQRAALAGQGIDVGTGTAVDLQADTIHQAQRDVNVISTNAMRESFGYKVQAKGYRMAGKNAYNAGVFNAAGDILGGVGSAGSTYYRVNAGA